VDREVAVDRNWVSSRQPSDLPAFKREMISLFAAAKQHRYALETK
jgi:protease I